MPPIQCQPNAATTRSRSPSLSKSAACTSATRGRRSASVTGPEGPVGLAPQPDDAALLVVGSHRDPEVGDQEVGAPVARRGRPPRRGTGGARARARETTVGPPGLGAQHEAGGHVGRDHERAPLAVEVQESHVRDERRPLGCLAKGAAREAVRVRSGRGPRLGRRQRGGRLRLVVVEDGLRVEVEVDDRPSGRCPDALEGEALHHVDRPLPRVAREDVRRGQGVAPGARGPHLARDRRRREAPRAPADRPGRARAAGPRGRRVAGSRPRRSGRRTRTVGQGSLRGMPTSIAGPDHG